MQNHPDFDRLAGRYRAALQFDLAIRTSILTDQNLNMRKIGTYSNVLLGGKACSYDVTSIKEPCEAKRLPYIGHTRFPSRTHQVFSQGEHEQIVDCIELDPTNAILDAVLAGIGVSVLPDLLLDKPEVASQIVRIAPRWHTVLGSIYAYTLPTRQRTAAVTAFIEWLQCAVKKQPFPVETE